jgi:drug/metabolite transporter (DMT)-like permease
MRPPTRTGYLLTVTAAMVWAATSPGIKYLLDVQHVPALAIAFWRDAFMAAACLLALLLFRPNLLRVSLRELRGLALVGAISIGLYHALWVTSVALNGAAVAVVLIYTFPVFVTLGAWLLFGEQIRWPHVLALIMALSGCALLVRIYDPAVLQVSWLGTLVGLGTGIAHAGYVLFSQRSVETKSPWTSLAYTVLFGTLALLVLWIVVSSLGLIAEQPADLVWSVGSSATPWLGLLLLSLGPTLGGYALFTSALRYIPGRIASLVVIVEAPVSVLIAVVMLGERLEWPQIVGIGLILVAATLPGLLAIDRRGGARDERVVLVGEPVADG